MTRTLLVAAALALSAGPAAASPATPVFGGYITQFIDHWSDFFKKQNGIVMAALGVGAVSLFIITRGKWIK
jgi:hypothetical protein